jgi:hypothetical protein
MNRVRQKDRQTDRDRDRQTDRQTKPIAFSTISPLSSYAPLSVDREGNQMTPEIDKE